MARKLKFAHVLPDTDELGFGSLEFRNYRRPFEVDENKWTEAQRMQVKYTSCADRSMDAFDVCSKVSGKPVFQLYFYPNSGMLFLNDSTTVVGSFAQHTFEFHIPPVSKKDHVLAYRLLLDLATAGEQVEAPMLHAEPFNPDEYLTDLMELQEIDLTSVKDFTTFEKQYRLKGLPVRAVRRDGEVIIKMENKRLTEFPLDILDVADLTHLNLSRNKISSIPAEIGKLRKLRVLDLSGNQIDSLPEEIGQLTELESLDLLGLHMVLKKFPDTMANLKKLRVLCIYNLPTNISKIPNLKRISFGKIPSLDPEVFTMNSLEFINLNYTSVKVIPPEIGHLKNLTELLLGGNGITSLPREIWTLPKLKKLYLHGNALTEIPQEIVQAQSLEGLTLTGNKITHLPEFIVELKNLKHLDGIHENPIENVPKKILEQNIGGIREYFKSKS